MKLYAFQPFPVVEIEIIRQGGSLPEVEKETLAAAGQDIANWLWTAAPATLLDSIIQRIETLKEAAYANASKATISRWQDYVE